jgi:Carboxypeptidase regulatory-like domain
MKRLLSLSTILVLFSLPVLSVQTRDAGKLKGRVVDIAGMPIPKVQITIQSSTDSFKAISDEDGYFEIQVPFGSYEVSSEKLPGFAATKRAGVRVEPGRPVEVKIVPAVSTEGVLCSLYVTGAPAKKQKKRKLHR